MTISKPERKRTIEINRLGLFCVLGEGKYEVMPVPDFEHPERSGFIVMESAIVGSAYKGNLHMYNSLCKVTKGNKLIPALFKSREMAEEVVDIINKRF